MKVCLIDFDGTITSRDTTRFLIVELIKIRPWRALFVLRDLVLMRAASGSSDRRQFIKNRCIAKLLYRLRLPNLDRAFSLYAIKCTRLFRAELIAAIRHHADQGVTVIVATASMQEAVSRVLVSLPVQVIGVRFPMSHGVFNGAQPVKLCFGEAKAQVIQDWFHALGQEPIYIQAWSDSLSDLPMMRMAQKRFWVCTDQERFKFLAADPGGETVLGSN